jgi:hypothetical protein
MASHTSAGGHVVARGIPGESAIISTRRSSCSASSSSRAGGSWWGGMQLTRSSSVAGVTRQRLRLAQRFDARDFEGSGHSVSPRTPNGGLLPRLLTAPDTWPSARRRADPIGGSKITARGITAVFDIGDAVPSTRLPGVAARQRPHPVCLDESGLLHH